jgi:predicted dinucleotide-binding enzyme
VRWPPIWGCGASRFVCSTARPGRLAAIRDAGGITVTGEIEGSAPISLVTGSLEQAVDGAGVVGVTVPTASLPAYAAALARRRPMSS